MMSEFASRFKTSCIGGLLFVGMYLLLPSLFICLLLSIACFMVGVEWRHVRGTAYSLPEALVYPGVPLALLVLHVAQWATAIPWYGLYPFIAAWCVDVAGYMVGSRWGTHRCWPSISPGKTWEGVGGGMVMSIVLHLGIALSGQTLYPSALVLFGAPLVACAAIVGDLCVSWFKRQQGIKDTGTLLPGHGGLLDRADSVLAVIVVVKLAELLFMH